MDQHTINKLAGSCYIVWGEPPKPVPYVEYPKLVYLADGSYVKVDNAFEEAAARGSSEIVESATSEHPGEKDESTPDKPRRGRPPKAKE